MAWSWSCAEAVATIKRRELHAVAKRHGWSVVQVFEDAGISGAKGRKDRPALDALLKSVARREVDMVAAWSVDRLGRSLPDLLDFLRELHAKGVDLFLYQQGLDTSTPSGQAMFQMLGVFAQFERAMIRERVLAGLARAKEQVVGGWRIATLPRSRPSRRRWRPNKGCDGSLGTWKPASAPFCASGANWRRESSQRRRLVAGHRASALVLS